MARLLRVVLPGHPHHVTQRGNRRQKVFFSEKDFDHYRRLLAESCRHCETACWAYCLMPNHVHLLLVLGHPDGLRAALAEAHRRYTRHVNYREGWRGHLWQERFHSFPMDEAHLLAAVRYVERNPVKAGLPRAAADWTWSSATAHLRGVDDRLVSVQPMLERVRDWAAYLSGGEDPTVVECLQAQPHGSPGRLSGVPRNCRKDQRQIAASPKVREKVASRRARNGREMSILSPPFAVPPFGARRLLQGFP